MTVDIEQILSRELREVAEGLAVPPLPPVPTEQPRTTRRWLPLAAAAAVVVVASAAAIALTQREHNSIQPAPAPTLPAQTQEAFPRTGPTIPYVVDRALRVGGHEVPGTWWSVAAGPSGWIAQRTDNSWWWASGSHRDPQRMTLTADEPPVISPNGRYVGELSSAHGGTLTGFDTRPAGEGLGGVKIDLGDRQQGTAVTVRAVLDDGRVIVQGQDTAVLWLPLVDNSTVALSRTAPGQVIVANTPVGLVVTDGENGPAYLADIADDGTLSKKADLPDHDDLAVSTQGAWLAFTPPGTTQGEVTSTQTLQARAVTGGDELTLRAPGRYGFAVRAWTWEDDAHLVATVVDAGGRERMARCGLPSTRCVLLRTP